MAGLPDCDSNGRLPSFAWPGGYPLFYVTSAGLVACPDCANAETSDPVTACDVHWEGEPLQCDDCGKDIESAYGVPSTTRR